MASKNKLKKFKDNEQGSAKKAIEDAGGEAIVI